MQAGALACRWCLIWRTHCAARSGVARWHAAGPARPTNRYLILASLHVLKGTHACMQRHCCYPTQQFQAWVRFCRPPAGLLLPFACQQHWQGRDACPPARPGFGLSTEQVCVVPLYVRCQQVRSGTALNRKGRKLKPSRTSPANMARGACEMRHAPLPGVAVMQLVVAYTWSSQTLHAAQCLQAWCMF